MPRLIWSAPALRDVVRLHTFLASRNPSAANRAVRVIRQGVRPLRTYPEIGRPAEDLPSGFRELVIRFGDGAYLARYHFDGQVVVILAIRHSREAGYPDEVGNE